MARERYEGLVLGGPGDGNRVYNMSPVYSMMEATVKRMYYIIDGSNEDWGPEYTRFDYQHVTMCRRGLWVPMKVYLGEVYRHKRWDHWTEFAIEQLSANYRPEGY